MIEYEELRCKVFATEAVSIAIEKMDADKKFMSQTIKRRFMNSVNFELGKLK